MDKHRLYYKKNDPMVSVRLVEACCYAQQVVERLRCD